jgi:propanediol utilization protein
VTREHADILFGKGVALTPIADLSQPGQFVCKERIGVIGPKGEFGAVVILGPERAETQVEISATDATLLGVKPPVRLSGELAGTPGISLVGPAGSVELDHGVMVAKRHIHMHPSFAEKYGLSDRQVVSVRIAGERAVTFDNTVLRVSPNFATYMHIDYDEANACGFKKGMVGTILVSGS